MARHEVKTYTDEVTKKTTYGNEDIHREYFMEIVRFDEWAYITVQLHDDENGNFEIATTEPFYPHKANARWAIGQLMATIAETEPHHYEALTLLADYAQDFLGC